MLATAALLAVGVAIYAMLAPSPEATVPPPAQTAPLAVDGARARAVALLRKRGYVPVKAGAYDPRHALRVLVAHRAGKPLGPRRAFFFAGGRFVAHDAPTASGSLELVASGDRWATLSYGRYAPGDPPCCPSAGRVKLRFELRGGAVRAVRALPGARVAPG
jgi:hypothetical protein